jgi:hypothetical protein
MHQGIQTKLIQIAIASDLHVHDEDGDNSPSHLRVGAEEGNPGRHPIVGLQKLVDTHHLKADLLLCPGDLGDKASRKGIQYAWKMLHQLKVSLSATDLLATVGNHDIDSYGKNTEFDPRGYLQSLTPLFPIDSEHDYDRFWSRHFTVFETNEMRVVVLNSSAFHGYDLRGQKDEHQHGRISEFTREQIKHALKNSNTKPINVLMCHHHPHQHSELDLKEHDVMHGGQSLLDLLGSGDFGEWLVVHGHKHHPKISYAAGTASSPIVFAAGSLCANLFKTVQASARNQFYLLSFDLEEIERTGLVGTFRAWDWIVDTGWVQASNGSGLPASGAFGSRSKPVQLAKKIAALVTGPIMKWSELLAVCPDVVHVIPSDLKTILRSLHTDFGIGSSKDENDSPTFLERRDP